MYSDLAAAMARSMVTPLESGDVVGATVRLAFHDAGEIDIREPDVLGVDGCVDLTKGDNAGLDGIIATLETLRDPYCHIISRADWWVLAAKVAVEARVSGPGNNGYTVPFRFGRTDSADCTYPGGRLPSAELGSEELDRVFVQQMGLSMEDAVTLLGAHTLGRAQTDNSG